MRKEFVHNGHSCVLYLQKEPQFLLLQPVDARDLQTDNDCHEICSFMDRSFLYLKAAINNWNTDLSPWEAPPVFGKEGFGAGAEETLRSLNELTDKALAGQKDLPVILGGYSLAGLFALWAAYQTDRFSAVAAVSPSVWFPDWISYAETRFPLVKTIYLSLGDKEEKTRNPVMATVGDCVRRQLELLQKDGTVEHCTLEMNEGNHFRDPEKRCAKGFSWCAQNLIN
ncbi:MAG: hypothetical protein IJJ30_00660 [Erysipelotrichaceae bacterium]|nr:hypothetical protein [Erysipelotrichaceae bacterium]